MGIAIGAGLAALLGGALSGYGWRSAFLIVGFPGILFALLVFFLREPPRQINVPDAETNHSSADWRKLLSNKPFVLL